MNEYASVQIEGGKIFRIDTGAENGTPAAAQFDGLKGYPPVFAFNKLAELDFTPLAGAIDHGDTPPRAANYTVFFVREKNPHMDEIVTGAIASEATVAINTIPASVSSTQSLDSDDGGVVIPTAPPK